MLQFISFVLVVNAKLCSRSRTPYDCQIANNNYANCVFIPFKEDYLNICREPLVPDVDGVYLSYRNTMAFELEYLSNCSQTQFGTQIVLTCADQRYFDELTSVNLFTCNTDSLLNTYLQSLSACAINPTVIMDIEFIEWTIAFTLQIIRDYLDLNMAIPLYNVLQSLFTKHYTLVSTLNQQYYSQYYLAQFNAAQMSSGQLIIERISFLLSMTWSSYPCIGTMNTISFPVDIFGAVGFYSEGFIIRGSCTGSQSISIRLSTSTTVAVTPALYTWDVSGASISFTQIGVLTPDTGDWIYIYSLTGSRRLILGPQGQSQSCSGRSLTQCLARIGCCDNLGCHC